MNNFSSYHPAVGAVYFVSVLGITMFTPHPALHLAAMAGAAAFVLKSEGLLKRSETGFYIGMFLLIALTNPLFSHSGVTPLFFLNGNPVTLEAVLYGADLALMLMAVILWFRCFNNVMTSDKLLYLFGGVSPKVALLISSALRFIPMMKAQAERIRQSQRAMGLYASDTWTDRLRGTVRVYSALITWGLEKAIDTGSSMKSRGYGLKGRSRYSLFCFRRSDGVLLAVILILDAAVVSVMAAGGLDFSFYPSVEWGETGYCGTAAAISFAVMCFLPFILEVKEEIQWRYYRSRI